MKKKLQGKVLKLYITKDDEVKTKISKERVTVDANGIVGDKFYAKNPKRAILITSYDSYTIAKENNINIEGGVLGENILIDINPYSLIQGETIKIGETIFEITQNCTLCKGLTAINAKLPKLLKDDRGVFAKVIGPTAEINIGDNVEILH
ncbi:MOSC domain-containing protein [Sulfurimonas sp.]|uniref:MOSC domain-containing protein n=1 Tax=Sulfurimonas sp. TaxID=2022749 RepID=UPI00262883CD|nr:MOSC domain-containing protein [Sulfurimonas sp.]